MTFDPRARTAKSVMVLGHEHLAQGRHTYGQEWDGGTQVSISQEKFEDLGAPSVITVTVVPGDELNG